MGQFRYTPSGNSVSIKPNQNGVSGSVGGVSDLRGNVGTPIGNTGWYHGGNAPGGSSTGPTMQMGHYGDVYFSGSKYPFQASYKVPKSAILDGLGMLCKNPVICLGLSLTAPAIVDWLNKGDVGINGDTSDYPERPFLVKMPGRGWQDPDGKVHATKGAACNGAIAFNNANDTQFRYASGGSFPDTGGTCPVEIFYRQTGAKYSDGAFHVTEVDTPKQELPASLDDIAPYMDTPEVTPNVVRDLMDQGADIKLPSAPTVTGPESLPARRETTQNPDGSVTTTTTTNNFRTAGNTITNTSTVTVTQTCMGDGTCSPATTTTTEEPKEPEPDDCEKNPDATRCQEIDLDTPDGEIPKGDKNVTYEIEDSWGGGSCPANIFGTINGQSVMLYDWGQTCGYVATYLRPLLLLTCALAALFIVMPGKADA